MNSKLAAMIRLDLTGLRPALGSMAILMTIALVMGIGFKQPAVGLPMLGVGFAIVPLQLFNADEAYGLRRLYGALPLRRRDVINSRYLLNVSFLLIAVVLVYAMVLASGQAGEPGMLLAPIWMGISLSIFPAVQVPMAIKFGPTKAMWTIVVPVALLMVIGYVIMSSPGAQAALAPALTWAIANPAGITGIGALLAIIGLVASWLITQRIYAAQDH